MSTPHGTDLTPAIGYIRVSMAREEMVSPQLQEVSITGWAAVNGRRIVEWVEDLDATGRNFRRKVMGIIGRIERDEAPAREVIVFRYDRWGRNAAESLANVMRVEMAGGALSSATEPLDPETAIGRYNRTNAFALAELQSDIIGDNWHQVKQHRVRAGLPPQGAPRFGYRRLGRVPDPERRGVTRRDLSDPDGERYVPDPETGLLLAGAYRLYAGGKGFRGIAEWLNSMGARTTDGNPWIERAVSRVLESGFGAGFILAHDPQCLCSGRRCRRRVLVRGAHDPVITGEEWQAYLDRREVVAATPPRARNAVYPVSGITRCWHCGSAMGATVSRARGRVYVYFVCVRYMQQGKDACPDRPRVPLGLLVEQAREWTGRRSAELEAAAPGRRSRPAVVSASARTERIAADITAADRAIARLLAQRAADEEGRYPEAAWQSAAADLRERRAGLEADLAAAKKTEKAAARDPLPLVRDILAEWDVFPPGRLRDMLREVIRIKVRRIIPPGTPFKRGPGGRILPRGDDAYEVIIIPVWELEDGDGLPLPV